jgi:hypothetical protein
MKAANTKAADAPKITAKALNAERIKLRSIWLTSKAWHSDTCHASRAKA